MESSTYEYMDAKDLLNANNDSIIEGLNEVEEENNNITLVNYAVDPDNWEPIEEGNLRTSLFSDIPVRQINVDDGVIEDPFLLYQDIFNDDFFIIVAEETNLTIVKPIIVRVKEMEDGKMELVMR